MSLHNIGKLGENMGDNFEYAKKLVEHGEKVKEELVKIEGHEDERTRLPERFMKSSYKEGVFSDENLDNSGDTKDIRPDYYGGVDNVYEAIKVIEAWELNFSLGSAVKYIARAGKKDPTTAVEDLVKARTYLKLEIERLLGDSKR